jgi:dethiobiotin synthase
MTGAPGTGALGPAGLLVITGTGTGVGKTIVTAALAALARAAGRGVAVVKPAQTGVPVEFPPPASPPPAFPPPAFPPPAFPPPAFLPPAKGGRPLRADGPDSDIPDIDTITRLSAVTDTHELARFPDQLSPEAAARVSGLPPLGVPAAADYIAKLAGERDLVLVEGAGGLLVRYDPAGSTLADLAVILNAPVLVVAAAGLGTLNHTALTCEVLRARGLTCAGVVIGSWPLHPGLADRENLFDLPLAAAAPLSGILPEGAGALGRDDFLRVARESLSPALGGTFVVDHYR